MYDWVWVGGTYILIKGDAVTLTSGSYQVSWCYCVTGISANIMCSHRFVKIPQSELQNQIKSTLVYCIIRHSITV